MLLRAWELSLNERGEHESLDLDRENRRRHQGTDTPPLRERHAAASPQVQQPNKVTPLEDSQGIRTGIRLLEAVCLWGLDLRVFP